MAHSRPLDVRRSTVQEEVQRVYVVNSQSCSPQGYCTLDDGSTVLCAFENIDMAINATSGDPSLRLVRERALSSEEQDRVEAALLE